MKSKVREIKVNLSDATGWLTIDRPDAKNALSTEMWQAIPPLMTDLYSQGARSIVLTGSSQCFASGADLEEMKKIDSYKSAFSFWNSIKETLDFVWSFETPTIAMIQGPCIGGACLLATACDMRFANEDAIFAVPVAKFGIVLDDETIGRLVALVGAPRAAEMLYTGGTISSAEAKEYGLINDCLEDKNLEDKVKSICEAIGKNGFGSVYESKKSIRRAVFPSIISGLNPQHETVAVSSYLTSDFRQRIQKVADSVLD